MPFPDPPPRVPKENPTGIYGREITIPKEWQDRRTVVHFGGPENGLAVCLDGQFVGIGKDSRLPERVRLPRLPGIFRR